MPSGTSAQVSHGMMGHILRLYHGLHYEDYYENTSMVMVCVFLDMARQLYDKLYDELCDGQSTGLTSVTIFLNAKNNFLS